MVARVDVVRLLALLALVALLLALLGAVVIYDLEGLR